MHRKNFQDLCQCFDVVANLGPVGKMGPPFSVAGFIVLLEGGTTTRTLLLREDHGHSLHLSVV